MVDLIVDRQELTWDRQGDFGGWLDRHLGAQRSPWETYRRWTSRT